MVAERPIKVDEQTDRLVSDLAHFLRSTKKSVVRDAVAEYAESRHSLMAGGAGSGRGMAARHRGTNIRVYEASDSGDDITLLVDTEPADGGRAAPRQEEIAHGVLATHITVISLTALRLMRPDTYRRALAESRPL